MKIARRTIRSPFVLEKSKLTRLVEVTEAKLTQKHSDVHRRFTLHLEGGRVAETDSLEVVFATDNSYRHRIDHLIYRAHTHGPTTEEYEAPAGLVSVDFDGRTIPEIEIVVRGDDTAWVNETFSAAEEQTERTLQRAMMARLNAGPFPFFAAIIGVILGMLLMLTFGPRSIFLRSQLADSMWLTTKDLQELEPLTTVGSLSREKLDDIFSRQVRNLVQDHLHRQPLISRLLHWRPLVMLAPLLILSVAFSYLCFKCYPSAVFLWGDAEDWYNSILNKRKFIWSTVVATVVLGVILDFFAIAITPR